MLRGMWISIKVYLRLVAKSWFLVLEVVMICLAVASGVLKPLEPTRWAWWVILGLSFAASNFQAFHKVRIERDEAKRQLGVRPETVRHIHEQFTPAPGNILNSVELAKEMNRREKERHEYQAGVLGALHAEFLETQRDVPIAVKHKTAPLPKTWTEKRLAEMGEDWRRDDYWPPR
jgi:hypothetical protein